MRRSSRRWSIILAAAALCPPFAVGCADRDPGTAPGISGEADEPPLLDRESSSFHFGPVIHKAGRKLVHPYRIANSAKHPIKVVDIVNRKPCCGEVQIGKTTLAPGEGTEVVVKLSINQEFGEVVHEVAFTTDPPRPEPVVLRTMARAQPAIRIEPATPADGSSFLGSGEPRSVGFRVSAYGTPSEPPVDLDRLKPRSTIGADWAAPKGDDLPDGEFRVESRRMVAMLDLSGPPGERRAEILIVDGEDVLLRHPVIWEVVAAITSSPRMIVLKPEDRDCRVRIQSRGSRPFRITRIECATTGVRACSEDTGAASTHTIRIEGEPGSGQGRGVVTVFTDHPDQARVDLPFVVLR